MSKEGEEWPARVELEDDGEEQGNKVGPASAKLFIYPSVMAHNHEGDQVIASWGIPGARGHTSLRCDGVGKNGRQLADLVYIVQAAVPAASFLVRRTPLPGY